MSKQPTSKPKVTKPAKTTKTPAVDEQAVEASAIASSLVSVRTVNWSQESTWTAIIGGVVTILSAFGILTAEEGTSLVSLIAGGVTTIAGIVSLVRGVINRKQAQDEDDAIAVITAKLRDTI